MYIFRVIFVLLVIIFVTETFLTSLENLMETEKVLIEILEVYIKDQHYLLMYLIRQYEGFKTIYKKIADHEEYKNNPIIAYQLIRRLYDDWQRILHIIGYCDSGKQSVFSFCKDKECDVNLPIPSNKDVSGAAWGVTRLQEVYLLSTADITSGNIPSIRCTLSMTAEDCYTIAKQCYVNENYVHASEWLAETLLQLSNKYYSLCVDKVEVLEQLILALCLSGDTEKAAYYFQAMPKHTENSKIWHHLFRKLLTNVCSAYKVNNSVSEEHMNRYQHIASSLCQKEFKYSSFMNKRLKCYYKNSYIAANIIKFKVEEAFLDPPVLIFHSAITTSETEYLKHYGKLYMKPARVYNMDGMRQVKLYRTSSNAWITSINPVSKRLEQRISAMTGLSMVTAESLQISNYGVGGEYQLHYDTLGDKVKYTEHPEFGDRIATFMFYLSDVKSGGSTVFPFLGLSVKPQKGSAVFWYNLMPSGTRDARTMHASCPVLYGNKWVVNKWIHEAGQEFIRPCPTST